jgi:phage shock protein PspC (stress-responsive transcriptional regulator)
MRVLFVVIFFAGGASLLAYLIMWIIVPEEQ